MSESPLNLDAALRGALAPFIEKVILREHDIILAALAAANTKGVSGETREALSALSEMVKTRRYYAEQDVAAFVDGRSEADT